MSTVSLNWPIVALTFPGLGILGGAAFLHVVQCNPLMQILDNSLPPERRTILSRSAFGGCPALMCNRRTLDKRDLVTCL